MSVSILKSYRYLAFINQKSSWLSNGTTLIINANYRVLIHYYTVYIIAVFVPKRTTILGFLAHTGYIPMSLYNHDP